MEGGKTRIYKQNLPRLIRLTDFFGITDSSGLMPLSQIRDNGMMNNAPSMEELEARAKAGEQISLLDVAEATKAEAKKPKQTQKTTQKQKKPSIRAQLAAAKEEQKKKPPAREKSKEMEV